MLNAISSKMFGSLSEPRVRVLSKPHPNPLFEPQAFEALAEAAEEAPPKMSDSKVRLRTFLGVGASEPPMLNSMPVMSARKLGTLPRARRIAVGRPYQ